MKKLAIIFLLSAMFMVASFGVGDTFVMNAVTYTIQEIQVTPDGTFYVCFYRQDGIIRHATIESAKIPSPQ